MEKVPGDKVIGGTMNQRGAFIMRAEKLGAETLLLGLALPDDNPHSPNEKFDLDCFAAGMRLGAYLWQELAAD